MKLCAECPMVYDPARDGQPADDRGGVYTGWSLPQGPTPKPRHQHTFAPCERPGCYEDIDASDGTFCSQECRLEAIRDV